MDWDRVAGDLLRYWRREVGQVSGARLGSAVGRDENTVYAWEKGVSVPRPEMASRVDEALGADGLLYDLVFATATPDGLAPRRRWEHNFPSHLDVAPNPVFVWVRTSGRRVTGTVATLEWGPLRRRVRVPASPTGVILNLPASVANPPLTVTLGKAGWVDFGVGRVPDGTVVPVSDALMVRGLLVERWHNVVGVTRDWFESKGGNPWDLRVAPGLRGTLLEWFKSPHSGERSNNQGSPAVDLDLRRRRDPPPTRSDTDLGADVVMKDLRRCRRLSREDAASMVKALLDEVGDTTRPVTADVVEAVEEGVEPRYAVSRAMLDVVYGADGRACCVTTSVLAPGEEYESICRDVLFPPWWLGPVWVEFDCPDGDEARVVMLRWHGWELRVAVRPGQVLALRQAFVGTRHEALTVEASGQWSVEFGVGRRTDAHDANVGWRVTPGSAREAVLHEAERVFLQACGLLGPGDTEAGGSPGSPVEPDPGGPTPGGAPGAPDDSRGVTGNA